MRDAATEIVIDALGEIDVGARPLVIDEETGHLASALTQAGRSAAVWLRRFSDAGSATPWPRGGPYSSALIRLQKSKDALDFALHAASSVLPPDAPVIVFGANDEGIRSAAPHLDAVADDVATLVARRHCRLIMGKRTALIASHRDTLAAWRAVSEIAFPGQKRSWISYPGVFAKGALDVGTALLIDNQPDLTSSGPPPRILDFAAGTGVVAAAVRLRALAAAIDLIEIDTLALEAARENLAAVASDARAAQSVTDTANRVPLVRFMAGRSLADARGPYDLILSNPPIHDGVREDHRVLEALISDAPRYLNSGGELRIVVQRRVKASALIAAAFGHCEVIAENRQFRVLSGRTR